MCIGLKLVWSWGLILSTNSNLSLIYCHHCSEKQLLQLVAKMQEKTSLCGSEKSVQNGIWGEKKAPNMIISHKRGPFSNFQCNSYIWIIYRKSILSMEVRVNVCCHDGCHGFSFFALVFQYCYDLLPSTAHLIHTILAIGFSIMYE